MEEQPAHPISIEGDGGTIIVNGPEAASGSSGLIGTAAPDDRPGVSGVHLLLMCVDTERHVTFHEGVIDNEGMNRRKSKCCCIYRKPHMFGESSSSSDDECEHCCGHPEVRLRNRLKKQQKQQQQQQQQQQQLQQQAWVSPCRCHHASQQAAPAQEAPPEVAGDSGNVKAKPEQNTQPIALVAATPKAVQH